MTSGREESDELTLRRERAKQLQRLRRAAEERVHEAERQAKQILAEGREARNEAERQIAKAKYKVRAASKAERPALEKELDEWGRLKHWL